MAAASPTFFSLFLLLGGLAGAPLSVPPMPEDPALARIAPPECLWYMSAAGTATPDANSSNRTEQLLAEPQIQQLLTGLEEQLIRIARQQASRAEEQVLAAEVPALVKLALTRPLAAYVADVQADAAGGPPQINAGLAVKLEERADEVEQSILRLIALAGPTPSPANGAWHSVPAPPDAPPVHWGTRNGWLIVGVGDGEADRIADSLAAQTPPPEWLAEARQQLPIEKRSTLGYLNVAGILRRVQPLMEPDQARIPANLGLTNVEALYASSGMDEVACVTKGLIAIDGEPRGILALLPNEPLATEDLQVVPQDATVAFALRLDPRRTLDRLVDLVAAFEPTARQEFEDGLWQAESQLGVDIRNDVLGALDDTLIVYMPGGNLFAAWTNSCATLKIKDRRRLERSIDKLTTIARLEMEGGGRDQGPRFRESEFGDYTLHYLQFVGQPMPFTPSWCVTEDYLVAGLTPQAVKDAITRLDQEGESLADVDRVQDAMARDYGPSVLTYVDTQNLVRGLYPMLTWGLQMASAEMAREGFEFDLALLPSVEAIAPHLVPTVCTWGHTPEGFRFETHQSLPGGEMVSSAPITIALLLPAIQSARGAARRTQEMNILRQLGLAALNHESAYREFPTNIYDEDGKPLLSWRVKILPFVEEAALYDQFHLDEPWDSPHNKQLIAQMPDFLRSPSSSLPEGHTRFLAFAHDRSMFPGKDAVQIRNVVDGTSNTILFVQAASEAAVEWTRPEDIAFDPENPKQGLMQPDGHFLAVFVDGHVQRIFLGLADETLRRLVLRNDGEPIDRDEMVEGGNR